MRIRTDSSQVKNIKNVKFEHRFQTPKTIEIDHTQVSHLPKVAFLGTNSSHGVKFAKCEISGSTWLFLIFQTFRIKSLFIYLPLLSGLFLQSVTSL